jgi:hypothetical protein
MNEQEKVNFSERKRIIREIVETEKVRLNFMIKSKNYMKELEDFKKVSFSF